MDTPGEAVTQKTFHDMPDGWQAEAGRGLRAERLPKMNAVARWIAHLAGPESGIVTGSIIDFDHGVIGCDEATPLPAPKSRDECGERAATFHANGWTP